ncbi:hypothetical protein SAMN04487881_1298 [Marinobacter sp. es.048]|uniref:DUF5666 domain-containing protein n=1 Tax=Marinobacter sp. es.048 TaxID=1761795 RepID=UPI000B5900DF|nr:DUF5666 domain-containing protein [Marinobacter sp. es.048]SNC65507.1 hypothetical protein SAMN04487881_1298 [Marinobacter sp. es.048]
MNRKPLAIAVKLAMTGALAGALAACGGGGSGDSSTSDTSSGTSVGAVSGFGSVYVNGTRFETDGSVSSDDGLEREDQLEKGMILKVEGDWDDRGEGRADRVSYDDTLRGPISAMSWDDITRTGSLTMLGQTISLDGKTVFRGATPTTLAGNPQDYRVRVSAWRLEDGSFRASFVGARAIGLEFDDNNEVEIEGVVADLDASAQTFTINGFLVDYTIAVGDDGFSLDDLANGIVVEVEGYLDGTTIMAEEIEDEDDLFDDDDDVEISGSIYDYDAASGQFSVNGVRVQIDGGTEFDDLLESSLADGLFVKVEGDFRNGVLVAEEIEGRDSDAELDGRIESLDLTNETMVVSGVRVQLTGNTLIDDDDDDEDDLRSRVQDIQSLQVGDYLEIEGRQQSSDGGFLEAISIEREDDDDDDDFELEARVSAIGADSITIMNLEVLRNDFSLSGAQVGDEVEIEYRQTSGGEYELTDNVEVDDDSDDDNGSDDD